MENLIALSEDERDLMAHISMWGSDGYPVQRRGRGWSWSYRGIKGAPVIFKTKRAAVASFEAYTETLRERLGELAYAKAVAAS